MGKKPKSHSTERADGRLVKTKTYDGDNPAGFVGKKYFYGADDESKVWDPDYKTPVIAEYYSWYEIGPYPDYIAPEKVWNEKYLTFPYPTDEITKSNGKLQNPPSWR